jgi:alginate O-acetyltransferase complex protein AlgI
VLFNSYSFLFAFLPLTLLGWWALPGKHLRLAFLTVASWVFYCWWDWRFLPLMLTSTTVDYLGALAIARTNDQRLRKLLLAGSLTINLGLLCTFKYAGFFMSSLDGLGRAFGLPVDVPALHILLPIGISFYTFNSMSYTIDVYRRVVKPTRNIVEYSAFVAMFPHLIAGPIVRFTDLGEQLRRPARALTSSMAAYGLFFFSCGLIKKLLIADQLSPHVDRLFGSAGQLGLLGAWAAAVGYTLQLYFDFSGYSDMAVGLAWLLGFRFPQNFNSPFKAENISDFWRRWHMTLSSWIRDYIYIPLGGSRRGPAKTVVILIVTMFAGGLWHGAAWTFVVWGLIHGVYLGGHGVLKRLGLTPANVAVNRAITFVMVVAAFVVFRSPDLATAGDILSSMIGFGGLDTGAQLQTLVPGGFLLAVAALLVFVNVAPNTWEIEIGRRTWQGFALGLAAALAVMSIAQPHPFIYFQF